LAGFSPHGRRTSKPEVGVGLPLVRSGSSVNNTTRWSRNVPNRSGCSAGPRSRSLVGRASTRRCPAPPTSPVCMRTCPRRGIRRRIDVKAGRPPRRRAARPATMSETDERGPRSHTVSSREPVRSLGRIRSRGSRPATAARLFRRFPIDGVVLTRALPRRSGTVPKTARCAVTFRIASAPRSHAAARARTSAGGARPAPPIGNPAVGITPPRARRASTRGGHRSVFGRSARPRPWAHDHRDGASWDELAVIRRDIVVPQWWPSIREQRGSAGECRVAAFIIDTHWCSNLVGSSSRSRSRNTKPRPPARTEVEGSRTGPLAVHDRPHRRLVPRDRCPVADPDAFGNACGHRQWRRNVFEGPLVLLGELGRQPGSAGGFRATRSDMACARGRTGNGGPGPSDLPGRSSTGADRPDSGP